MELSDQELAKKMKARMEKERQRQRRWRNRQKDKGLKSIAGMVSQEAFDVIQKEKKRTGEKVSDILERAILNLETQTYDEAMDDAASEVSPEEPVTNDTLPLNEEEQDTINIQITMSEEEIVNRIKDMRTDENLPFNEIAKRFNNEGLATLSGEGRWDGKTVYNILKISK